MGNEFSIATETVKFETIWRYFRLTLLPHGIWRQVIWQVATEFSEKPGAYLFRVERRLYSPPKLNTNFNKISGTTSHTNTIFIFADVKPSDHNISVALGFEILNSFTFNRCDIGTSCCSSSGW